MGTSALAGHKPGNLHPQAHLVANPIVVKFLCGIPGITELYNRLPEGEGHFLLGQVGSFFNFCQSCFMFCLFYITILFEISFKPI